MHERVGQAAVPIVVGPAVPSDAGAILALHRAVLAEGEWFITEADELRETIDHKVALVREAARSESACFLVARRRARVVGWAHAAAAARRRIAHVARIELMVDAQHRGHGVGSALLTELVRWGERSAVIRKLSLQVFAHNVAALDLYRRHGFFEEGRREREYRFPDGTWRDDVLMARFVGEE